MWVYLDTFERATDPFGRVRDKEALARGMFYFQIPSWGDTNGVVDADGVLVTDFDRHHARGTRGRRYMPINIAQFALHNFDRYAREGAREARDQALSNARWLLRTQRRRPAGGVWEFDYPIGHRYKLPSRWVSALAQGEGASVLVRAYKATGDDAFRRAALAAVEPFGVDWRNGGVRSVEAGTVFFEEYPTDPPHHVLNGCLVALMGLVDVLSLQHDPEVADMLERGLDGVECLLPHYDTGWWSRYSLSPTADLANHWRVAAPHYHFMHVVELEALGRACGRDRLRDTARRWAQYLDNVPVTLAMNIGYLAFKAAVAARNRVRSKVRPSSSDGAEKPS